MKCVYICSLTYLDIKTHLEFKMYSIICYINMMKAC